MAMAPPFNFCVPSALEITGSSPKLNVNGTSSAVTFIGVSPSFVPRYQLPLAKVTETQLPKLYDIELRESCAVTFGRNVNSTGVWKSNNAANPVTVAMYTLPS